MTTIDPPTSSAPDGFTAVGSGNVNYVDSELRAFRLEDLKAATRGSWSMADQIDPKTFQRLANLAVDTDRT